MQVIAEQSDRRRKCSVHAESCFVAARVRCESSTSCGAGVEPCSGRALTIRHHHEDATAFVGRGSIGARLNASSGAKRFLPRFCDCTGEPSHGAAEPVRLMSMCAGLDIPSGRHYGALAGCVVPLLSPVAALLRTLEAVGEQRAVFI